MADGTGKSEAFGPWLIKAGVPLAVAALAALVYARKKSNSASEETPSSTDEDDDRSVESTACDLVKDARNEVVLGLVDRINKLQAKEEELEARFERYQSLKECEGVLVELTSMLNLEIARGDYLEREVLSIEAETKRVQELEIYGLKLFQQVKSLEQENKRLKKKVKMLFRKNNEGIRVIGAQKLRIRESEAVIMRSRDEIEKGADVVNKMGEEISELQGMVEDLRKEKMVIFDKLELAKASLTLKNESEIIRMDEYKCIINELEKLQKEFTAEANELVFLRWTNACLRRQLMQRDEQEGPGSDSGLVAVGCGEEHTLLELELHHELDRMATEHENSSLEVKSDRESKRRALLKKLKKWVEGSHHSKMSIKANKGDVRSFGRHYASDWVDEHVHGRKSFSSA
ncbi:unnamed protein product [Rhodiola kirilowii]